MRNSRLYYPGKIEERLDVAERQLGWRPEYYSIEESDKMVRHFNSLLDYGDDGTLSGKLKRDFTEKEKRFIRNERILCACDAHYWLTRYAYIKTEEAEVKRFAFRLPQKIYYNIIAELEAREAAIQIQALKARQLGVSTVTELLVCHRVCFYSGVNAVIASAARQPTQIMSQMLFLAYDRMPFWLRPKWSRRVESDQGMLIFGGIESGVHFQHGAQQQGIGRGTTPTVIHISEVASFTNADELIEKALFRAVHESPSVFMVLESTAEGETGWWADTWQTSRKGWSKGMSRLCPLFLPWFVGSDLYPKPTWIKTRPIPESWKPSRETMAMMAKSKMFLRSQDVLLKVLGPKWDFTREQAWYWEVNYLEHKEKGAEKSWFQEMPCDDIECFQSGYDSVFGRDLIAEIHTKRERNYKIYGIVGPGIEEQHEPYESEEDYDKERKEILWKGTLNAYKWDLIPILENEIDEDDPNTSEGKLLIFHEPREGCDYTVGVDTAGGKGLDSTVISVWLKGRGDSPDIQVAEWSSSFVSHVEAYAFVVPIAAYYSRYMDKDSTLKEPLIVVENLAATGDTVIMQIRKMGYTRLYRFGRYDDVKISKKKLRKVGWFTTGWSRPMLVDGFVQSVKNGWAEINSPFLLYEMGKFEVHQTASGKEKLEHSEEEHDDRIMAAAMGVYCAHDRELMIDRGKKRYVPTDEEGGLKPPIDISDYKASRYLSDEKLNNSIQTISAIESLLAKERFSQ